MATLAQVRTRVNAWLADRWPIVVARQENYRANRGRYWQGLLSHSIVPAHTNGADGDAVADRLTQNPSDQFDTWKNVFPEWDGAPLPAAIRCDTYSGPLGDGYCVTIFIRFNGTLYSRSQNVGPESHRTHDWMIVEE
jgi:hypothetical protein